MTVQFPELERLARGGQARGGVGLGGIPTTTAEFSAALQAKIQSQAASVQQTLAAQTGVDTTQARVSAGAQAAVSLAQNGYNPADSSDNAKLVHAIAGGVCLIPGVGPILGAAVEGLWLVGSQIACPVTNAFAAIGLGTPCGAPPCKTTGNWTPAGLIASHLRYLPAMPTGSFASLAVAALATYAANAGNCKGGMPPDVIVDAVVAIWNQTHAGPAYPYFVPPIVTVDGQITPDLLATYMQVSGTTQAALAGKDPNAYYAFGPVAKILSDGHYESNPPANLNVAQDWTAFSVAPPPSYSAVFNTGMATTSPRIVMVNAGALLPALTVAKKHIDLHLGPPSAPATPLAAMVAAFQSLSLPEKVAVVAGGAAVTTAAGGSIYALATHQTVGGFWSGVWQGAMKTGKEGALAAVGVFDQVGAIFTAGKGRK